MPRGFIADYSLLSFNSRIAEKFLHGRAKALLRSAVKAWVKEAESRIPVWSGMSRGTLVKLAGLVGEQVSQFGSTAPGASPPKGPGSRWSDGQTQSTARLVQAPGRYGFRYSSSVFHLEVNETENANAYGFRLKNPGPYNFRQAADARFNEVMRAGMAKFPWRIVIGNAFKIKHEHI